jgi:molybdopterin synthase sulfur carrier subunit
MQILYFAWLREKIGKAEENLQPPPGVTTVGAVISWLQTIDPEHQAAFADPKLIRCAVDQEIATADASISGATELAFFPPVTGG